MEIIKQLRKKIGINQSDLASAIGVSLRTVQLYEKKNANIPMKNLKKIAGFFEMDIGELYLHEVNDVDGHYSKKRLFVNEGSIGYRLDNGKALLKVPFVAVASQKDFLDGANHRNAIKKLFRTHFLLHDLDEACYMAFEITGNAMENTSRYSIPNGALVLGRKIDKHTLALDKKDMNRAFVLVCPNRIICKSITGISMDNKTITCHNLNPSPEFKDFDVPMDEVRDIYEVVRKQV